MKAFTIFHRPNDLFQIVYSFCTPASNELTGRIPPTLENLAEDGVIILQAGA